MADDFLEFCIKEMSHDEFALFANQDGADLSDIVKDDNSDENTDIIGELSKDIASRTIRTAKRNLGRHSPGKDVGPNGVTLLTKKLPLTKNSRKSRNGRGRGLPKKGGAGGKGVWGKPGEEITENGQCKDVHDPNYNSASEDEYLIEEIETELSLEELEKILEPLVLEYYENNSRDEVVDSLRDLNLGENKLRLVEYLISKAVDHKATHCEMTSVLLSELYGQVLSQENFMDGFHEILNKLPDLVLDVPNAPEVVGKFLARAVADDCLPPKYIQSYRGKMDCKSSQEALLKANTLLTQKHGIVRLDNIWGTSGGIRPVKYIVKQNLATDIQHDNNMITMQCVVLIFFAQCMEKDQVALQLFLRMPPVMKMVMLLKEYLSSGDIQEATRCLIELDVPHFHHELVYEAVNMVLEISTDRAADMIVKLLKSLSTSIIISPDQFTQGFQRIFDNMADICLDVPKAYILLDKFATACHRDGIISGDVLNNVPQRGRKRFVSEGDGGLVKDS